MSMIVVGVSGGIAAYKAVSLVRLLVLAGHEVHVVPTESALRFVGTPTWEAISRHPARADVFDDVAEVRHVALGQRADLIVLAPATANTLARVATGLADDLLGTTVLASTAPLVVAPAMHTAMWENPATQASIRTLASRGAHVVDPGVGALTGADSGAGRMAEPEEIAARVAEVLAPVAHDLAGRRILITAGGTREAIDPVRFIGNRSSGRQGVELARAARDRGAEVLLVAAALDADVERDAASLGVHMHRAASAAELEETVAELRSGVDAIVMAAAVSDYRVAQGSETKIKKEQRGESVSLDLVKTTDVLAGLIASRRDGEVIVGFAAETANDRDELLDFARDKLRRKTSDLLVANAVGWSRGFGTADNEVIVLDRTGDVVAEANGSKASVAHAVLDAVRDVLTGSR